MNSNFRNVNSDMNIKTTLVDIANIDDELKYYNQFLQVRKNFENFIEKKRCVLDNEIKEKQVIISQYENDINRREYENSLLLAKINDLSKTEAEITEIINKNKEEIAKKYEGICQKRRDIFNLFDVRVNDLKKREKETDLIIKELYLIMNILKIRIINLDDIQSGADTLKAYFVNNDCTLKYIEIDLTQDESTRYKRFSDLLIDNYLDLKER